MITLISIAVALAAAYLLPALLFIAVYDHKQTAGMSFRYKLAYCFRQIASPWPWR